MKTNIDDCINDALTRLSPNKISVEDCDIRMWAQEWNDTSCGFGGDLVFGFACTKALCLVVMGPNDNACVYHNGKFAYYVDHISDRFLSAVKNKNMPGASCQSFNTCSV